MTKTRCAHALAGAAIALAVSAAPAEAFPGFYDFEKADHRGAGEPGDEDPPPLETPLVAKKNATDPSNFVEFKFTGPTPASFRSTKSDPVCIRKWPSNYQRTYAGHNVLIGAAPDGQCDATRALRIITNGAAHYVGFWVVVDPTTNGPNWQDKSWKVTAARKSDGACAPIAPDSPGECVLEVKTAAIPMGQNRWVWFVDPLSRISSVYVALDEGSPQAQFGIDGVGVSAE
jgi:hypothetical protein